MKLLAVFALLCVMVALTSAEAAEEPKEAEPETPQAAEVDLDKRVCRRRCPRGWTRIRGRCFLYVSRPATWLQAEWNCKCLGGHLASVHSAWEYRRIRILIRRKNCRQPQAWIGGNDRCREGHWRWTDRSRFNYRGWCCGEPNNGGNQDCLQINYSSRKCWDDLQCHHRLPSVCARRL